MIKSKYALYNILETGEKNVKKNFFLHLRKGFFEKSTKKLKKKQSNIHRDFKNMKQKQKKIKLKNNTEETFQKILSIRVVYLFDDKIATTQK